MRTVKKKLLKTARKRYRHKRWQEIKRSAKDILGYTIDGLKEAFLGVAKAIVVFAIGTSIVWIPVLLCILSGAIKP